MQVALYSGHCASSVTQCNHQVPRLHRSNKRVARTSLPLKAADRGPSRRGRRHPAGSEGFGQVTDYMARVASYGLDSSADIQ